MMTRLLTHETPLIKYLAMGCKPPSHWRIGTEHEKFLLKSNTLRRFAYDGDIGIRTLLETLQSYGWEPILEQGQVIALKMPDRRVSITLEPGGSLNSPERPLPPFMTPKQNLTLTWLKSGASLPPWAAFLAPLGTDPLWSREEIPWMPKAAIALCEATCRQKNTLAST